MRYLLTTLCLVLLGCAPAAPPEASREAGQALFAEDCALCHGADGTGDGPMAAGLKTQPADLTRIAARRDGVWPMLEVMSIVDGYSKRTRPREEMPIIVGLTEGPMVDLDTGNGLVTPTPARLVAIVRYLESIQSPPPERYVP